MDTIKNYLEAMFAKLPNTPEVLRAKDELLQMMEDKYTELRENGRTENEAVGTVISEFGNLDVIAEDLGIKEAVSMNPFKDIKKVLVPLDEAKRFIKDNTLKAIWVGLAVMFCIISVTVPMIVTDLGGSAAGSLGMFAFIGLAVGLFVYVGLTMKKWNYIKKGEAEINYETAQFVKNEEARRQGSVIMARVIGVVLCATSWLPSAVIGASGTHVLGTADGGVFLFLMVGMGVFLLVYSGVTMKGLKKIRRLNSDDTVAGTYSAGNAEPEYINPTAQIISKVFWPVVACLYVAVSFITFRWDITWVIWPVAAVVGTILNTTLKVNK